ncbi:NCS2 family permease [Paenibacillus cymbidii]|uniref:NCS2 family permease n=1 Tax=Paenibacillus cymbidii TaxID=1639034 RepID=UPI001080C91B|nr:NCS2 family permease [Paenibacillus cymbidii]
MFQLSSDGTTIRKEIAAGLTSFITASYIVVVNGAILSGAGLPYEAAILSTVLAAVFGCLLMSLWADSPLIIIPGMGDNSFFAYTLILSLGLTWQQGLAAVLLSGIVFAVVSLSKRALQWIGQIPGSLIAAMTAGIGLFITFLGLKKGGLIVADKSTFVALGSLNDPHVLTAILALLIALPLYIRGMTGSFLIAMTAGTLIGGLFGIVDFSHLSLGSFPISFAGYPGLLGAMDFSQIASANFWIGAFSLSILVVFQNMGAQLGMLPDRRKFQRSFQANAFSIIGAGLLGCSSTVSAAEGYAGIAAGGRTGLTSLTAGILFLPTLLFVPLLKLIPDCAIAPIFIIIGGLMALKIKDIPFADMTEWFPAYLMLIAIPLTFSIAGGIAIGFIAYLAIKLTAGRSKEIPVPMYAISAVCLLYFVVESLR